MDEMFARFKGRKALRKNDNVLNSEVVDISGSCLRNDNVNYVNLVDDCDEDVYVSEHRFENEDLHKNSEFAHNSSESRDKSVVGEEDIVIPFLSQNFPNLVAAENVIRAYALKNGFAIKIQNTQRRVDKTIYARTYVCNLAENRDKEPVEDEEVLIGSVGSEKKKRRRDKLPRSGCKFRIYVINRRNTRHWEITSLELNHNHDVVSPSKMNLIKRERHVTAAQKNLIKSLHVSGIAPRQQMNIFGKMHEGEEQVGFHAQHLRNVMRDFRKDNLGVNDAQAGLDLLHRYVMPFVPFTEVNHHYQPVLFDFALMRDELKTTFEWVLGTWLEAGEGKAPLAIITDQDQAMAGEIQSQLPNTTHLLCSWHIIIKFTEKLSTYYAKEEFKGDFNNCIYHSLTEEIFEDRWKTLILKYKLEDNTWLQGLYNLKNKWIDAYTRNIFSAGQRTTSRSEGMNAFFDAYVGSCMGLKEFVEGAQKALEK
ncbi:protein FAR1-RELATED SEQUENCE 5-like [Apium graveolens]|uniref:protein FAR1-RELATED SEQUENCE 5-like n=1 Tax=Apium graveolens TaxID=4045 RepID=UPI003D79CBC9